MDRNYSNKVLLRPVEVDDYNALVALFTNPVVREFLGGPLSVLKASEKASGLIKSNSGEIFAIVVSDEVAGTIEFSNHLEEAGIEVSYQLLPKFMGKGIAFAALSLALQHSKAKKVRIVAETQAKNLASIRLLSKLGFVQLRDCMRFNERQLIFINDSAGNV